MPGQSFTEWLSTYVGETSPLGTLADKVITNLLTKGFGKWSWSSHEWRQVFVQMGEGEELDDEMEELFAMAEAEYLCNKKS